MAKPENPIQRYKRDRNITFDELAEEWSRLAGEPISATYIRKLATKQRPSANLAKDIESWTSGAIKAAELLLGEHLNPTPNGDASDPTTETAA